MLRREGRITPNWAGGEQHGAGGLHVVRAAFRGEEGSYPLSNNAKFLWNIYQIFFPMLKTTWKINFWVFEILPQLSKLIYPESVFICSGIMGGSMDKELIQPALLLGTQGASFLMWPGARNLKYLRWFMRKWFKINAFPVVTLPGETLNHVLPCLWDGKLLHVGARDEPIWSAASPPSGQRLGISAADMQLAKNVACRARARSLNATQSDPDSTWGILTGIRPGRPSLPALRSLAWAPDCSEILYWKMDE